MFASLRSRLWLTNALIMGIVLGVSAVMVFLFVRSVPIRTTNIRLQEVSNLLGQQEDLLPRQIIRQENTFKNLSQRFNVRILLVTASGNVVMDTASGEMPALRRFPIPVQNGGPNAAPVSGTVRDMENRVWQYSLQPFGEDHYILVAAVRPPFQWLNIFTDEFLPALLWASGIAILLAVILSWLTARGVSRPLKAISEAAKGIPSGNYNKIETAGPAEVRQLAETFNSMIDKVRASQQAQQDFVANVSHDLKTPLTSIQGFAQAILDGTVGDRQGLEKAAGVIYEEAGRMHRLVVALLDLTRLDSGAVTFVREPLDIALLVEKTVARFTSKAGQARVDVRTQIHPVPQMFGDGDRLAQVFQNLLDNAIQHTPAGGAVAVEVAPAGGDVEIRFSDTGQGIPPGELDRIFERFYQVDKSRARRGVEGSGLGLSIAKEIVEAHGGSITAESRPGQGSVFVVKIPIG